MRWPNGSATRPNISSGFGPREGGGGASTFHRGVDFTGCNPVRAIAAGQIVYVGTPSGWSGGGLQVWIQHDGYFSRSMHMGGFAVSGGWVEEGQILGSQDTTGTASGSHLHLEITLGGVHYSNSGQIDPVPFISDRISGNVGGGEVAQLQLDLTTAGYPTVVDDDYGPDTEASVTQFQIDYKLAVDGQAGSETLGKLAEVIGYIQGLLIKLGYAITHDSKSGPQTVGAIKDFQTKNGLDPDGSVGPLTSAKLHEKTSLPIGYNAIESIRSTADVQRLVGAEPDGIYGPDTTAKVMAWQTAHPPLEVDGIWGMASDAVAFPPTPGAFIPVELTGRWDVPTIKALQASLGFTGDAIDGDRGHDTILAQQKATGVPEADQDGVDGDQTVRHLQAALGVRQDGQAGNGTMIALQTLLNAGRKLIPGKLDPVDPPTEHPQPEAPTFPLAIRWGWSPNSEPRTGLVKVLVGHHWGMFPGPTPDQSWDGFMRPGGGNPVSCNLQINADGTAFEPVPPDDNRAWTTGALDHQAITYEMQNSSGPDANPPWGFSPAAIEMAAQYLAWGHKRYGIPLQRGKVTGTSSNPVVEIAGFVGHNETPAGKATGTTCPGSMPYDVIIARAREIVSPDIPPEDSYLVPKELGDEIRTLVDTAFPAE